jgi:phosphatidylglycerol lysyltransferase
MLPGFCYTESPVAWEEGGEVMRNSWRTLLYMTVGAINVLSALLPIWPGRYRLLEHRLALPLPIILGAQDATLFAGLAILLLAYPAAKGHRAAARLLMACAAIAIVTNVLKGFDVEEALLDAVLLVALWRGRHSLHSLPVRYSPLDVARLAVVLLVVGKLYSIIGNAVLNGLYLVVHKQLHVGSIVRHIQFLLTAKLELQELWFHQSQVVLPLFLVGLFMLISWSSLIRPQGSDTFDDPYARFGRASHNSLAYIARRSDVLVYDDPSGHGAISYRLVGRVALQVGAIMAPVDSRSQVYRGFLTYCRARHLIPAAVALSREERRIVEAAGMRAAMIGTEAMVDLAGFSIERLNKKMRWVQRSLAKRGYTVAILSAPEITDELRAKLHRIDSQWRMARGGQDHGCCMTLGRFPTQNDPECLISLAYDAAGDPIGYLTLLPGGEGCYSLDLTRRAFNAPNATMEFLVIETLRLLQARVAGSVSLNFSTASWLHSLPGGHLLLDLLGSAFQLHSLEAFNNKFKPAWAPRYMVFPSWLALPDVVYATLVLEGVDRMFVNACARSMRRRASAVFRIAPMAEPALQADGL